MKKLLLATASDELNKYIADLGQFPARGIREINKPEGLLKELISFNPDILVLSEFFLSCGSDAELANCFARIRNISNVRIIYFCPGRKPGDRLLDFIIRECGVYDLFLDERIDGCRLATALSVPATRGSVAHLVLPAGHVEKPGKAPGSSLLEGIRDNGMKDLQENLPDNMQDNIGRNMQDNRQEDEDYAVAYRRQLFRNMVRDLDPDEIARAIDESPEEIREKLIQKEVVTKEVVKIREVPKVIVREKLKLVEKVKTQKQQVMGFWSGRDGSGRSHLLTQLAFLLATEAQGKVAALDLDCFSPALDIYFGARGRGGINDFTDADSNQTLHTGKRYYDTSAVTDAISLINAELAGINAAVSLSGQIDAAPLYFLKSPMPMCSNLDLIGINPEYRWQGEQLIRFYGEYITMLLNSLKEIYDFILIDFPVMLRQNMEILIQSTTYLYIVAEGEWGSLRSVSQRVKMLGCRLTEEKCHLVINKAGSAILEERDILDCLPFRPCALTFLPYDEKCNEALLINKPYISLKGRRDRALFRTLLADIPFVPKNGRRYVIS